MNYKTEFESIEKKILSEWQQYREIKPRIFFMNPLGRHFLPVLELMESPESKRVLASFMNLLIEKEGVELCCLVSESWMFTQQFESNEAAREKAKHEAEKLFKEHGSVSAMPGRVEVVMLILWTKDITALKFLEIKRDVDPPELKTLNYSESTVEDCGGAIFENPFFKRQRNEQKTT